MSVAALQNMLERRWHSAAASSSASEITGWKTGLTAIDRALAPVGIPHGRLTEIFGAPSSGKTTLACGVLAACTSHGDIGAYVDTERGLFAPALCAAGIDVQRLIVVRPKEMRAVLRAVDALVRSSACAVVVLDAKSAAMLQTHHFARLVTHAEKTGTTLIALSQGASQPLASFATLRVRMSGLTPLWQAGSDGGCRLSGYMLDVNVAKSKLSAPGKNATFTSSIPTVVCSWPTAAQAMLTPISSQHQQAQELDVCYATSG